MRNGSALALITLLCLAIIGWGMWLRYGDEQGQGVRYKRDLVTVKELHQEMSKDFESIQKTVPDDPAPFVLRSNERGARLDSIERNIRDNAPKNLVDATRDTKKANEAIGLYIRKGGIERLRSARALYATSQQTIAKV